MLVWVVLFGVVLWSRVACCFRGGVLVWDDLRF